jgi:hypothetical protein
MFMEESFQGLTYLKQDMQASFPSCSSMMSVIILHTDTTLPSGMGGNDAIRATENLDHRALFLYCHGTNANTFK